MIEYYLRKLISLFLMLFICGFTDIKSKTQAVKRGESILSKDSKYRMFIFGNLKLISNDGTKVAIIKECSSTIQTAQKNLLIWTFACRCTSFGWEPRNKKQGVNIYFTNKNNLILCRIHFIINFTCKAKEKNYFTRQIFPGVKLKFKEIHRIYLVPEGTFWKKCDEEI